MLNIGLILGSTRQGRKGELPYEWVKRIAQAELQEKSTLTTIDLRDWNLPHFDSPISPAYASEYTSELNKRWSTAIAELDGFIIVTPEYNHGYPGVLKDALDHLYKEWNGKPVAFVSYGGGSGGIRAVEQLRLVTVELQMIPIRPEVNIRMVWEAFDEQGVPKEVAILEPKLTMLLVELLRMAEGLKALRKA